jgi:hypothetical protein
LNEAFLNSVSLSLCMDFRQLGCSLFNLKAKL